MLKMHCKGLFAEIFCSMEVQPYEQDRGNQKPFPLSVKKLEHSTFDANDENNDFRITRVKLCAHDREQARVTP